MRIPNWPALVCGWMLAAMIGQTVLAADPADEFSEALSPADSSDDSGPYGDLSNPGGAGGSAYGYQPAQYADGGAYGGYGAGFAPGSGGRSEERRVGKECRL